MSQELINLENAQRYSSIGKMLTSNKTTMPMYGFGTGSRYQAQQVYKDKKLIQKGKHSPGPIYNIRDAQIIYQIDPRTKFGNAMRKTQSTSVYDHFLRMDNEFEPQDADNQRRVTQPRPMIGCEERFRRTQNDSTPGPIYDTSLQNKDPAYTLGARRKLDPTVGSTPDAVGPGRYTVNQSVVLESKPNISFTKAARLKSASAWDANQTYDTRQAIGVQVNSKKPTRPAFSIGKQKRDNPQAVFKQDLARHAPQIRVNHPKF